MRKFYSRVTFILVFILLNLVTSAQTVAGYTFSATAGTFTPLSGGTPVASLLGDDVNSSSSIPIGFNFFYAGGIYNSVTANSNGWLSFNPVPTTVGLDMRLNNLATTAPGLHPLVAPLWDDLEGDAANTPASVASYATTGAPGSRVFTFEWLNWARFNVTTPSLSMQVKFYEATGVVEFIYRQDVNTGAFTSATVGISGGATSFISLADVTAAPTISTTTSTNTITARPATGQIYRFTPPSCSGTPTPGTITGNNVVCNGQSTTLTYSGGTGGFGISYQWLSSTGGGPYQPIAGATSSVYTTPALTATISYAISISCGGNTTAAAPFNVTVPPLLPAGIYTIGGPAGPNNYASFSAAINAMSCGIAGPVTFNVAPGAYDEQISIPAIPNASAVNTVTFNGNGAATLQGVPVTALRHIVQLNGADYIRFRKLKVLVQTGTQIGWGFHLTNGADNNIIDSCTIDVFNITDNTQSNSAGIVLSGSGTSVTTAGAGNNNAFTGNTIIGGYQGVIISGVAATRNTGNVISGNTISNFYLSGVILGNTDGTVVNGNNISRSGRPGTGTFSGVELTAGNLNVIVSNNRIHDTHNAATSQTGAAYGVYFNTVDATAGNENKAYNNLIYNFNSGSGNQFGIHNNGSDGAHAFHNTIVLNHSGSTAGATRGFYQTVSATNVQFRNNIVYISRAGSGVKHAIFLNTAASSVNSNNNVLFVAPAATNHIGSYNGTNFTTLANWKTANTNAYDQQSVSDDPVFADPANGIFYPNNSAISSVGASVGVTTDFTGSPRDLTTPTPGAYEIVAAVGLDVGVSQLLSPVQKTCYGATETVTVTIKNYSATPHNLLAAPVTVNVSVTGPNATTFTPVVVNSGILAPDATLDVVISTTYNMSAPGAYVFNASAVVTNDANPLNDALPATTRTVAALAAGTVSATPGQYCITGGTPVLSLAGSSGGAVQWQESSTGVSGSWTNVGTDATSYTPAAAITATRYYRAYVTCGANGDTSNMLTVALNNPQLLTSTGATRCGPGTVTLSATAAAGSNLKWYTAATGGIPVGTGTSFTTPVINTTTDYYVAAASGAGATDIGLSPTATNCGTIAASGLTDWPLRFNTTAAVTINSAYVIPQAAGDFTVALRPTLLATNIQTATFNFTAAQVGIPQQIILGFVIPNAGSYQLTNTVGGVHRIATFTCAYPMTTSSGSFSIVGSATSSVSVTNTNTYNTFFQLNVSQDCETPRTAVTATITPAAAFDITNNTTACNNAVVPLQVNSSLASFNSYVWAPATGLYSDPNATVPYTGGSASIVFARIGTAGVHTYVATANNSGNNCQNIDSVKLTVLPATVSVSASPSQICVSGSTSLSFTPTDNLGTSAIQWSTSPDGTTYTPITNATGTTFNTPVLTSSTYYKLEIKDNAGAVCLQPTIQVVVNTPQLLTSTPAVRCGPGTVDLTATSSAGTTINWYAAPTGGIPLATGASFTTPSLTGTTTYYVAATSAAGSSDVGVSPTATNCGTITASGLTDWPLRFNTTAAVTINSAYVIPQAAGTLTVALRQNGNAANIQTASFTFTAAQVGVPQQITLAFTIPAAGSYQLTNTVGGVHRIGTFGCTYPMTTPSGAFSIVGSATTSTAATGTGTYNSFFQLNVSEGCESPRTAVTATVSPNTGITTQPAGRAVCTGATVTFTVNAVGANLTYQWRKGTTNIAGATGSSYTISAVTVADAGAYNVVITGLCGTATSTDAALTVAADNSWLGTVNADWNNSANWCGGIPTATSDVIINSGTPFQPVLNAIGQVRNLTINNGASVTLGAQGFLNVYGNVAGAGSLAAAQGTVAFMGTINQNVGALTAATIIVNGAGGVTLGGAMTTTSLVLANGNITLGTNNLSLGISSGGSAASHIITNGTGSAIATNITGNAVTVPVGPNATSYNPAIISNGQGRNYTVRVATGITPAINNPARAVNRTWNITPSSAVSSPVDIVLQYADADVNGSATATVVMEAGVHNGTAWSVVSPGIGVTPSGTPGDRQVGFQTAQFGPMVIGNFGALSFPTALAGVDADVTSVLLMPNPVQSQTVLRVQLRRAMRINWCVIDANGRIVMTFGKQLLSGQNDMTLQLSHLAAGTYQLLGSTEKGKTKLVRFIKL